jgi:predicted permease
VLTVVVLLAIGVVAGRLPRLPDGTARVLDAVVINISLPALVLALVPKLELTAEAAVPVAVAWASLAVSATVVWLLSRSFGWDRRTTGTLLVVVPLGNTSFLGIPAVEALLGALHLPYAIIYDQLGSFLALTTYGAVVAGRYGSARTTPHLGETVRRVLTFPPFVALVVAAVLIVTGLPAALAEVAARIGATVTPLTMIAVGMRLRLPRRDATLPPLVSGLVLRLIAVPALAYGTASVLGADGRAWDASVLEAAMPPMVTASVVAIAAGLDERLAANLVGVGVLAAMATLPVWATLLT